MPFSCSLPSVEKIISHLLHPEWHTSIGQAQLTLHAAVALFIGVPFIQWHLLTESANTRSNTPQLWLWYSWEPLHHVCWTRGTNKSKKFKPVPLLCVALIMTSSHKRRAKPTWLNNRRVYSGATFSNWRDLKEAVGGHTSWLICIPKTFRAYFAQGWSYATATRQPSPCLCLCICVFMYMRS